jgi:hypothetical protein
MSLETLVAHLAVPPLPMLPPPTVPPPPPPVDDPPSLFGVERKSFVNMFFAPQGCLVICINGQGYCRLPQYFVTGTNMATQKFWMLRLITEICSPDEFYNITTSTVSDSFSLP